MPLRPRRVRSALQRATTPPRGALDWTTDRATAIAARLTTGFMLRLGVPALGVRGPGDGSVAAGPGTPDHLRQQEQEQEQEHHRAVIEQQRKLLEQLMGPEALGIVQHDISLYDPKLCHPFVAGICPHDLFTNTKMDLGPCAKTHSVKLKTEYEELSKRAEAEKDEHQIKVFNTFKMDYEREILNFVGECDRRIAAAHRRLEKTPEENNRTTALMREVGEIEGAYQAAMADVETLGSQGKVEESMTQLTKAEALKSEKLEKERELQQLIETAGASGHQKLRVCDICGAYLSVLDSDRRLADHFGGKMHLGYHQLRELMDEWNRRGPLPTAPLPAVTHNPAGGPNGAGPNGGPAAAPPPPTTFRPIPPEKRLRRREPSRDRDRDHRDSRDSRDHRERERDPRDRDSGRGSHPPRDSHRSSSSRYDRDERERSPRSSRRSAAADDYRSSSRRDDRDRERERERDPRDRDDRRRSSRYEDEDRRRPSGAAAPGAGSASGSASGRYEEDRRTRRAYDDIDEPDRTASDKRRRIDE
ncbi:splicing factor [Rhodotorula sphaerocarpa]